MNKYLAVLFIAVGCGTIWWLLPDSHEKNNVQHIDISNEKDSNVTSELKGSSAKLTKLIGPIESSQIAPADKSSKGIAGSRTFGPLETGKEFKTDNYKNGLAKISLQDNQYNSADTKVLFVNANDDAELINDKELVRSSWHKMLPAYGSSRAAEVYTGVDLLFYEELGRTDFDIQIAPEADVNQIQIDPGENTIIKEGAENGLLLNFPNHPVALKLNRPVAWQYIDGRKVRVESEYVVSQGIITLSVGEYDKKLPLVVD